MSVLSKLYTTTSCSPVPDFKAGAESEYTSQWNRDSWQAIRFRPRVLRPIEEIYTSTTILGNECSVPFFICPTGGGKLAHPKGEVLLTKAAAKHGVLHWISNVAGCLQKEMTAAGALGQNQCWQIYAMSDLAVTEKEIKQAVKDGFNSFCLTVDAIRAGKRERDMRMGLDEDEVSAVIR
jgi:L-lactate dehydrogenase (cytochrome)